MKTIQYAFSRQIIHFGLWIMPDGKFKRRLLEVLWQLNEEVYTTVVKAKTSG